MPNPHLQDEFESEGEEGEEQNMPNPHLQDEFENEEGEGEEQQQPPPPLEARQGRARVVAPRGGGRAGRPGWPAGQQKTC